MGLFAIVAAGKFAQPTADSAVLLSRISMSGFLRFSIWGLERSPTLSFTWLYGHNPDPPIPKMRRHSGVLNMSYAV